MNILKNHPAITYQLDNEPVEIETVILSKGRVVLTNKKDIRIKDLTQRIDFNKLTFNEVMQFIWY